MSYDLYIYISTNCSSPHINRMSVFFFGADWRFDLADVRNVSSMNNCINILSASSHLVMSTLD